MKRLFAVLMLCIFLVSCDEISRGGQATQAPLTPQACKQYSEQLNLYAQLLSEATALRAMCINPSGENINKCREMTVQKFTAWRKAGYITYPNNILDPIFNELASKVASLRELISQCEKMMAPAQPPSAPAKSTRTRTTPRPAAPVAPTCIDGAKNGGETDVDCGGATCTLQGKQCGTGKTCAVNPDCSSGLCVNGVCQAAPTPQVPAPSAPTCIDGAKNGDETDIDCGGICKSQGKQCGDGKACAVGLDCTSGICTGGLCQAQPACTDGVKNGGETDVDCGGSCSTKCGNGKACSTNTDCTSGLCTGGLCQASPACTDGVKNGAETDVDCGGSCTTKCGNGKTCSSNTDCSSGSCQNGACQSANVGPTITSTALTSGKQNQQYTYSVVAADPDNKPQPLKYTLTQFPSGMSIGANGVISWTPSAIAVSGVPVTVEVSDGDKTAVQNFNVVVCSANQGTSCGTCSTGSYDCSGTCQGAYSPSNWNKPCGPCGWDSTDCNGNCMGWSTPSGYNTPCGCGGVIGCNGCTSYTCDPGYVCRSPKCLPEKELLSTQSGYYESPNIGIYSGCQSSDTGCVSSMINSGYNSIVEYHGWSNCNGNQAFVYATFNCPDGVAGDANFKCGDGTNGNIYRYSYNGNSVQVSCLKDLYGAFCYGTNKMSGTFNCYRYN